MHFACSFTRQQCFGALKNANLLYENGFQSVKCTTKMLMSWTCIHVQSIMFLCDITIYWTDMNNAGFLVWTGTILTMLLTQKKQKTQRKTLSVLSTSFSCSKRTLDQQKTLKFCKNVGKGNIQNLQKNLVMVIQYMTL